MNSPLPQNHHTHLGQRLMAATRFTRLYPRAGQQQHSAPHAGASGLWHAGWRFRALIAGLFMVALLGPVQVQAQSCGLDIHIANDNSGSVDSTENRQARDYVSQLGMAFELGNTNDLARISISTWSHGNNYELYDFPVSTGTYTTSRSDVLSYASSARTFSGNTNVYKALQKAAGWLVADPIALRTAPKVIVLMTDAYCNQISPNITSLATQIKDSGVYIEVFAIGTAAACTDLQGTNVASPGGYFSSANPSGYQGLQDSALSYIQDLQSAACDNAPSPEPNLTVSLNFGLSDCDTTPLATANYTVTNVSSSAAFSDQLEISFYNGDPTLPGSQYLFTVNAGMQSIAANGGTYVSSVTSATQASLLDTATLYAVVNIDGSVAANAVPLSPTLSGATLTWTSETVTSDNISSPATRTNAVECIPYPQLDVQVSNGGQVCDDNINCNVQVCNTGTADANVDPDTYLPAYPPAVLSFVESQLLGTDPFVGSTLPAGACAIYNYVYNRGTASTGTTYHFSVDVKELDLCLENPTTVVDVAGGGYMWMDRNLGASQAATSSTDAASYGDLYQWGRYADCHQFRTSILTTLNAQATTAIPSQGNAWDGKFIIVDATTVTFDWLATQDDNLWQGVSGTNNPCPAGYRLPTEAELTALGIINSADAYAYLGMPAPGQRRYSTGSLSFVGILGYYWSSTVSGSNARSLYFHSGNAYLRTYYRAEGNSVRCLKD